MKLVLVLACLVLYAAQFQCNAMQCNGGVSLFRTVCFGKGSMGSSRGEKQYCHNNANDRMWWYDVEEGTCKPLSYLGCDGNRNRYCTLAICEQKCLISDEAAA